MEQTTDLSGADLSQLQLREAAQAVRQENWTLAHQRLKPLLDSSELSEAECEQVVEVALQILSQADFQQQWEVAKLVAKLGNRAISPLVVMLENEDAHLDSRWFAGRILSEFNHPAATVALTKLLRHSKNEELLSMAAQALARIGPAAVESLRGLLEAENSRLLAVQALSCIRCSETIEPLLEVASDPSAQVRAIAIEALGSFHDERIPPILIESLHDLSAAVRKEAIIALGMRSDLKSQFNLVECLKPLLYDFNLEVGRQAAFSLGRMGNDAAAVLFESLSSVAPSLKVDVVRALSWIESISVLEYLEAGLNGSEETVCQEIVACLGRLKLPQMKAKATQILVNFLASELETVKPSRTKQVLALSLGELGQPEAASALLKLAEDPQQSVRLHARAALQKLKFTVAME